MQKRNSLFTPLLQNPLVRQFLEEVGLPPQGSTEQYCRQLWGAFRPSSDMSENVGYHLKNEMKARLIAEAMGEDEEYVKKYGMLSDIKYFRYRPSQLAALT